MLKKGHIQTISFYDKNYKKLFFRQIVYPLNTYQVDVYRYFLESISFEGIICVDKIEECYYLMENSVIEIPNPSSIDNRWIDGNTYLIEYTRQGKYFYFTFVTANNLTLLEVKRLLKHMIGNISIKFIDKMSDCWIKKELI